MESQRTHFFALLIGINNYKLPITDIIPLHGAVNDAECFRMYLEKDLGVPGDHIESLLNEKATRAGIIKALEDLSTDKRIENGDAIFIFYAGHGAEIEPPLIWQTSQEIQAIVPYDCDSPNGKGKLILPIPDYILGLHLSTIMERKGDNITVVFDCCYSGSGTRGKDDDPDLDLDLVRGVDLDFGQVSLDQLEGISTDQEAITSRSAITNLRHHGLGLGSHVLLSACGATEKAREHKDRGRFSAALLDLLTCVPLETLRYSDILRHSGMAEIPRQNPQCEGRESHLNRTIFNSKIIPVRRKSFDIYQATSGIHGRYIVQGGRMNGINLASEFGVYRKTDLSYSKQISALQVADDLKGSSFVAKLSPGARNFDGLLAKEQMVATQIKFGAKDERLRIHIPPKNSLRAVYNDLVRKGEFKSIFDNIDLVEHSSKAQVTIMSPTSDTLRVTMPTPTPVYVKNEKTLTHVVNVPDVNTSSDFLCILSQMAHFYRELNYGNDRDTTQILPFLRVEFYELEERHVPNADGRAIAMLSPKGPNLCINGKIDLRAFSTDSGVEDIPYGIKIVNNSAFNLYANAFYFSTSDLSIRAVATSHVGISATRVDVPLKAQGGSLEIGFGPAGYEAECFKLDRDLSEDIVYLKLYLSTKSVNLGYLPQESPFGSSRSTHPYTGKTSGDVWTNIITPVILHRLTNNDPALTGSDSKKAIKNRRYCTCLCV